MKKKVVNRILVGMLVGCVGLFGCTSQGNTAGSSTEKGASEAQQATDVRGDSDYELSIDGCEITNDYAGKKAAVVTYTWKNNSEKDTSFMVAISDKAFQNGIQLDSAIVNDIDSQASMNNIKPGVEQTVKKAYELDDDSDMTVECSELISFSDELLAEAVFQVV